MKVPDTLTGGLALGIIVIVSCLCIFSVLILRIHVFGRLAAALKRKVDASNE